MSEAFLFTTEAHIHKVVFFLHLNDCLRGYDQLTSQIIMYIFIVQRHVYSITM